MSKLDELLRMAEMPEFKKVLENWDSSILSNEAENEMGKVLKGQQPKAFLTWLLTFKDKEISHKKIKLKKDIIRESVLLLGEILLEENDCESSNTSSGDQNAAASLECSVCKTSVLQEGSKDVIKQDLDAMMLTLAQLKMHWICVDCKEELENNKAIAMGGEDEVQYLENQTKSLQINEGSEEPNLTEIETIPEDKEGTNALEIERKEIQTQTEELQTASVQAQTEENPTTNMHTQTTTEAPKTRTEERTTTQTQTQKTSETVQPQIKDVQKPRKVVETKNSSTQTLEKEQIAPGEKQIEEEYRKQIEREVKFSYDLKKSKEKQKTAKISTSQPEHKQNIEIEKHKLEMEKMKLELDKHDLFMKKSKMDERLKSKNTLYSVLVAEIEKKSLKRHEEPKKDVNEEQKINRYPKSSSKHPETDTEKEVSFIRSRLEYIIDNGGDWRKTMDLLKKLDRMDNIDLQILTSSKIVWTINDLQRYSRHPEVTDFARRIARRWKRITPSDHRGRKYEDDHKSSKYPENKLPAKEYGYREKSQNYDKTSKYKENKSVTKEQKGAFENIAITFETLKIDGKVKRHVLPNISDIDNSTQY